MFMGPWKLRDVLALLWWGLVRPAPNDRVGDRLIAAAPDLLKAAKAALAYDAAIQDYARTGRVAVRGDGSGDAVGDDLDALYTALISAARAAVEKAVGQ